MAEYNMQELNLPGEDGKRILYPRMKLYGQVNLETITEKIAYASSFTRGDIIGLMQAITDEIAYQMGQGYSVKIDNLGVFTPALGLRQDRERETGEEGDTKRNAVSICLKDIHFKVDKELLYRTARHCHLKRSTDKFQRSSQVFSPQERLERAKKIPGKEQLHDPSRLLPTDRLIEVCRLPRVARMDSQSRIGHRLQRTRNTQDLYSKETITHIH